MSENHENEESNSESDKPQGDLNSNLFYIKLFS